MFGSASSGTELLLQGGDLRALINNPRRNVKTPIIVASIIFVVVVIFLSVSTASTHRSRPQNSSSEPPHPVMARLAEASFQFNESWAHGHNSSDPVLVVSSNRGGKA